MVTLGGEKKRAVSRSADRPRSLREALGDIPVGQRDNYLALREAFLSLEKTSEMFRAVRSTWRPVLLVARREVATVKFAPRLRKGMTVELKPLPEDWLAGLSTASDLQQATRRRLRNGVPGRAISLPVNSDEDLADIVVVLLLLHAWLVGERRL
ncbi:MAG: hypothetical protein O7C74_08005 [Acidobacteria bacterium]|nr:hypothetical protein [Acidobacteriota bacterium]